MKCRKFRLRFSWHTCSKHDNNLQVPYILESNPHPNLFRTSFCPFLKRKKKVSSRF